LGLGVLSVAPSSATVSQLTVTAVDGKAVPVTSTTAQSDTTTAAIISVSGLLDTAKETITVSFTQKSVPSTSSGSQAKLGYLETTTSTSSAVYKGANITDSQLASQFESVSAGGATLLKVANSSASGTGFVGANFFLALDTMTGTLTAGTYTYTVIVKAYGMTTGDVIQTVTKDVNITIAALASASKTASAAYSTLGEPSVTSKEATVSTTNTAAATLLVTLKNSEDSTNAQESVTATITGPGTIGVAGGAVGKSVVLQYTGTSLTLSVYADGTAGVSTINVSTPNVTFSPKTVTFFAKAAKTITPKVNNPVLKVGANPEAISATAVDANGATWTGAMYIVASAAADALIGGSATTPVACTYNTTDLVHYCPVTAIAAGTAKFKLIDASTVALATATSSEVSVTVSTAAVAKIKLAFDKASYAPNEKATITVTPVDASGNALPAQAAAAFLASGGITSNYAFSAGSETLTASTVATSALTGAKSYTVYMPAASVDVVITATGGAALPVSGQTAVTATATVVNSSVDAATDAANEATDAANAATDAALAAADAADAATAAAQDASDAVAALSASVSKLISSLRAQITSLTNLVIKIQKKVKA
jgi:hypothetical protein